MLIEPLCADTPRESEVKESFVSSSLLSSPSSISSSSSSSSSSGGTYGSQVSVQTSSGSSSGSGSSDVKMAERKAPCKAYTPISVCSRNVVSCFRGGELQEEDALESAVQVPWIAHVLMGSGLEPDTYLDINLIQ